MGSTSDCLSISGIADKGASRVCNNVAPDVHFELAGLALDDVRLHREVEEDLGVVGLSTVAAGGHGGKKNVDL